jgi:hypothetical protein
MTEPRIETLRRLEGDVRRYELNSERLVPVSVIALRALPDLLRLYDAAREEHALLHPGGTQMMGDGSWRPCPVCEVLARLGQGEGAGERDG